MFYFKEAGCLAHTDGNVYDLAIHSQNNYSGKFSAKKRYQIIHGRVDLEKPIPMMDKYFFVSQEVADWAVVEGEVIDQPIDIDRFKYNTKNAITNTVLIACQGGQAVAKMVEICKELDVRYKVASKYMNSDWNVEQLIQDSFVVVGVGRIIPEALCCGKQVVVYDDRGYFKAQFGMPLGYMDIDLLASSNYTGRGLAQCGDLKEMTWRALNREQTIANYQYAREKFNVSRIVKQILG